MTSCLLSVGFWTSCSEMSNLGVVVEGPVMCEWPLKGQGAEIICLDPRGEALNDS